MIREPDPAKMRGREPTSSDHPDAGDEVAASPDLHLAPELSDRPPAESSDDGAAGPAVQAVDDPDPAPEPDHDGDPVVDLRRTDGPLVTPARATQPSPDRARRSVDATDAPRTPTGPPAGPPSPATSAAEPAAVARHFGLADRVLVVVAAPLVALVLTLTATTVLLVGARSAASDEAELVRAASARLEARAAVDDLHAAVLATVAAGVGQSVMGPDELARRSGAARSAAEAGVGIGIDGADPDAAAIAADDAALAYIEAAEDAVDRTGGDPLDLGNELSALDELHAAASSTAGDAVDELESAADAEASTAASRTGWGLVVAVAGTVLAAVLVVVARRRLARQLDRPVRGLRGAVARIGHERPAVASVVQGPEELVVLGAEIDAAARSTADRLGVLERRAVWGERSRMILEALELADDEPQAYEVVGEALGIVGGPQRGELLLSERGTARLASVAASAVAGAPGCPVDVTTSCVALRRGQVSVFDSSETINACPKLRDRPSGACSAVCVPVTVAGRQLGVLHMTGDEGSPPGSEVVEQLVTLSSLVGNRLGSLRTLESSRHEASTDGLTGLPNRRTLEAEVAELIEASTPFVMVLADLDKFKRLNDNFGHEVGDKALQLFAGVLRDNVRGNDVVARLGGEEFVLVYPNMSVEISVEAIDRLRQALARAVGGSRIPPFTCSFGVAHSSIGGDGDDILRVADAGLLRAKELGGDRAVVADEELVADVFTDDQD